MIGDRVKRCATKILDEHLLAKKSSGDLVASESKYHTKCLVALYNAARSKKSGKKENCEDGTTEMFYARAFVELVAFIEDTLADREQQTPVYKLSDLVWLCKDRLAQLSVSSPCVYSTRLKHRKPSFKM